MLPVVDAKYVSTCLCSLLWIAQLYCPAVQSPRWHGPPASLLWLSAQHQPLSTIPSWSCRLRSHVRPVVHLSIIAPSRSSSQHPACALVGPSFAQHLRVKPLAITHGNAVPPAPPGDAPQGHSSPPASNLQPTHSLPPPMSTPSCPHRVQMRLKRTRYHLRQHRRCVHYPPTMPNVPHMHPEPPCPSIRLQRPHIKSAAHPLAGTTHDNAIAPAPYSSPPPSKHVPSHYARHAYPQRPCVKMCGTRTLAAHPQRRRHAPSAYAVVYMRDAQISSVR
jgi:hypothetical protein